MGNTFQSYAEKYNPYLDEVLTRESKTSMLRAEEGSEFKTDGKRTVKIAKMTVGGLGDYSRSGAGGSHFPSDDVAFEWESFTLTQDKGASRYIDYLDNEEELNIIVPKLGSEFVRTAVVPTVDAYTFSKIASTTGIIEGTDTDIVVGTTNVADMIDAGVLALREHDAPEDKYVFLSDKAYAALQKNIVRTIANDERGINRTIEYYDNMEIIRVPQSRFYDTQTFSSTGGFSPISGTSKALNFLIVPKKTALQVINRDVLNLYGPDKDGDGYTMTYRLFYDVFIADNKVSTIYASKAATPVA